MRAIAIMIILMMIFTSAGAESQKGWVLCQPDSKVNIRARPSKHSEVVGYGYAEDQLEFDGRKSGKWLHCKCACEAGEGWIRADYVSFDEPEDVGTGIFETTENRVIVRSSVGGREIRRLQRGTEVRVYILTADYSVTEYGFIKTEFLIETGMVKEGG